MAEYIVKAPDGRPLKVKAPDEADEPSVFGFVQSLWSDLQRQAGLTGRATIEGLGDVAGIVGNPIAAMTGARRPAEIASELATDIGLPQPATENEQFVNLAGRNVVGAGTMLGAGQSMANIPGMIGKTGQFFAAQPGLQIAQTLSGTAAQEAAKRSGASPAVQIAANIGGGMLPSYMAGAYKILNVSPEATAKKLRTLAENMEAKANESLNADRLTNTAKRARQASYADENARKQVSMARTIRNVSDAIETGEAPNLKGIRFGSDVELLDKHIKLAKWNEIRATAEDYAAQQAREGEPITEATIEFAHGIPKWKMPANDLPNIAGKLEKIEGLQTAANELLKVPADSTGMAIIPDELADKIYAGAVAYDKAHGLKGYGSTIPWQLADSMKEKIAFRKMGITTPEQYKAALQEFNQYRGGAIKADPAKELERKLVGQKVGIDFFPTPPTTAQKMVDMADIQPGMKVLEPSAGTGNIAEVIRKSGIEPEVGEISTALREVLEAKKFKLVSNDFMEKKIGGYDAIVMNPPFSNNQDIQHIQHAYDLLKPGGRLVSIVGEGAFFRSGKTESAFRDWLEQTGAQVETLEPGTFTDKSLLATTGVNARLVKIVKP